MPAVHQFGGQSITTRRRVVPLGTLDLWRCDCPIALSSAGFSRCYPEPTVELLLSE